MKFVRWADTRQLLHTLEQLRQLSLTLAELRDQQGRTAQAAAARRAAELLTAEQTRRTHAAHAGAEVLVTMNSVGHNTGRPVRFTRAARKQRIGRAHALHVIPTVTPTEVAATDEFDARRVWLGPDDRGVDLEIVALVLPTELLVIHVMPTALRGKP